MTDTASSDLRRLFAEAQAHHHAGRLAEAQGLYAEIVGVDPKHGDALNLLGTVLAQRGNSEQAVFFMRRATQAEPARAPYHVNLGVVLTALGRYDEAKACFDRALKADDKFTDAYYNLGNLLKQMELPDAALLAYEQARTLDPKRTDILVNMGNILYETGRLDEAAEMFNAAIYADPKAPRATRALINLGNTFRRMGDAERAGQAYDLALARDDSDGLRIKRATTLPVVMASWDHIRAVRYDLEMNLRDLLARDVTVCNPTFETSTTNFFLAYHGEDDRRLQELTAQLHLKSCHDLAWTAPHIGKRREGKIRVGFVSAFFRRHSIGRLMEELIANLAKDEFEIVIVTQPGPRDPVARRIEGAADTVIKLPEGFWPARDAIAAAACDILIYPEIGMDVRSYFLAFARLAPVQAVMWGHPDTTGIPNLDWFVSSDLIEGEGAEAHYSEKLYRLKTLPTRYARPEIPAVLRSRDSFGLAADKTIYLCQQSVIKHHPDLDVMIAEILRGDPKGEVVLLEGAVSHWSDQVRDRMRAGIPDVAGRVRVIPRMGPDDFIALTAAADVVFDAPHWSGGNTSFEAFALGKAVATHAGTFMRGRVTLGQYRAMGMGDEFARTDIIETARLALHLGLDKDFRKTAETRLAVGAQKLWDDPQASAEFAAFLRFAHQQAIG